MTAFARQPVTSSRTLGDLLADRRLELGWGIPAAAQKSQVAPEHIQALEEGTFATLPADVYAQGFVRRYAETLGISAAEALRLYKKERGIYDRLQKQPKHRTAPPTQTAPRMIITPRAIRRLVIGLIVLAALTYVVVQVSRLRQPPRLTLLQPTQDTTVQDNTILFVGETEVGAHVTIQGQVVFLNETGMFQETISLEQGLNEIHVIATNKLGRSREIIRRILSEPSSSGTPRRSSSLPLVNEALVAHPLTLTVIVEGTATWLSVFVDGLPTFQGTISPNTRQSFAGFQRISVTTGQADKTRIIYNGKDLGYLGKAGEAQRRVEFTATTRPHELLTFR